MSYTLANLKELAYYHGWNDTTTTGETALTRFINRTLMILSTLGQWPEYHKRDGRVKMSVGNETYLLTDSADKTIANISKIGDVLRSDRFAPLDKISLDDWMIQSKTNASTGSPLKYALQKYVDTSGQELMEICVWPTPSAIEYLYFPYHIYPTILSASTDVTDWPDVRIWLFEAAVEKRVASGNRDANGAALFGSEFMGLVNKALGDSRTSYMPVLAYEQTSTRDKSIREVPIRITE